MTDGVFVTDGAGVTTLRLVTGSAPARTVAALTADLGAADRSAGRARPRPASALIGSRVVLGPSCGLDRETRSANQDRTGPHNDEASQGHKPRGRRRSQAVPFHPSDSLTLALIGIGQIRLRGIPPL